MLQWFGGMGIIVLAVAILPILGVGGMQLYRAEMPGPLKDNKNAPANCGNGENPVVDLCLADRRLCAGVVVCWNGCL
ncbi:potassium transporter TrkG [Escherichia coli]